MSTWRGCGGSIATWPTGCSADSSNALRHPVRPAPLGVAPVNSAGIDISAVERRRDEVWDFVNERADVPVDPELGPPWHIGVQPARRRRRGGHPGGVAHRRRRRCPDRIHHPRRQRHPPRTSTIRLRGSRSRPTGAARGRPHHACGRCGDVPAAGAAARSASPASSPRNCREVGEGRPHPPLRCGTRSSPCNLPTIAVRVDQAEWDARATALGGSSNALLARHRRAHRRHRRPGRRRRRGDAVAARQRAASTATPAATRSTPSR